MCEVGPTTLTYMNRTFTDILQVFCENLQVRNFRVKIKKLQKVTELTLRSPLKMPWNFKIGIK